MNCLPKSLKSAAVGALLVVGLAGCGTLEIVRLNNITTTRFQVEGTQLRMAGDINAKTYDQFLAIMDENPQIRVLVEDDIPGSVDDNTMIRLAYKVRELGLDTHLTGISEVYSGGVDLFLAGVHRTMEKGAKIGVHSWSDGVRDAKDYPRGSGAHEQNRKYIEDMLGRDDFYWFTIYAAPADGIHLMTVAEIRKYGLLTAPAK